MVRPLVYGDLPAVLAIERRSFATPWSLAMFVLELSKPSGICLAIGDRRDNLVGYLVCSRYADVWHLMNIAVVPERRREGIASELMVKLFEAAGAQARFTLEVRTLELTAIGMYERFGFQPGRPSSPLLPRQRRGRADHVAGGRSRRRRARSDPRDRDVLRRHLRRGRRRRADPLQRDLLAGRVPRALRRRRSGGRLPAPPRARQPDRRRRPGRGRGRARRARLARGHPRARADRGAADRRQHGQGPRGGRSASR